jgi:RNA polymerase sigma factor for flagellar operon FliA
VPSETIDRDDLARQGMPLVGHCVTSVAARVPRHVRHDELVSAGLLGLAQAARSWDPDRGVGFEHYARQRIHGALLDELRGRDWASRSVRRDGRQLNIVSDELAGRLGRAPADAEVAHELGVSTGEVQRIRDDVGRAVVLHLDAFADDDGGDALLGTSDDPAQRLLGQEMRGYLRDAVIALPERLRKVMVEYFFEERPMQEIAQDLGVTVSRVSQMRAQALTLMREGIAAQFAGDPVYEPVDRTARKQAAYAAAIAAASTPSARISSSGPGVLERLQAVR